MHFVYYNILLAKDVYDIFFTINSLFNLMWSCFLQLNLREGGLHADINGDGVLDHVQVRNFAFERI